MSTDNITDYDYLTNSITSQEKNFFTTLIPIYDKLDIVTLSIVLTLFYVTFGANWFLDYRYILIAYGIDESLMDKSRLLRS